MAFASRLAGAILASSEGEYYLIGDLKEPLDFTSVGFATPAERDVKAQPYVRLDVTSGVLPLAAASLPSPGAQRRPGILHFDLEGTELATKLADCFMIKRNGSISERLWGLVMESSKVTEAGGQPAVDGRWLAATPDEVWEAVRDTVLRC